MTSQSPSPGARRRAALIAGALAILVGLDFGLGTFWGWLRSSAARQSGRLEREYRIPNPVYFNDLKPNISTDSAMWGPIRYSVRTNALGFRDSRIRDVALQDTGRRVLLMGDSFLEGIGVSWDSTFAGILEPQLRSRGIEILNAAVSGYAPVIYWKKTQDLLIHRQLRVSAVVVLFDELDMVDGGPFFRLDAMGNVQGPAPASLVHGWANHSLSYRAWRSLAPKVMPNWKPVTCVPNVCLAEWLRDSTSEGAWGRIGRARADTHMTRLAALLRSQRIPLTIVVYPRPEDLRRTDRLRAQQGYWQNWARREGEQFVSVFDAFFAYADSLGAPRAIDDLFIHDDIHWSAAGHALAASAFIAQWPDSVAHRATLKTESR